MEKTRKLLKVESIIILFFAGLSLITWVTELIFADFDNIVIPDGAPENALLIAKIAFFVIAFVLLIPNIYVGIKGLKMAKNPDSSKAHIVWAKVLLVIDVLGLISPVINIVQDVNVSSNVSTVLSLLLSIAIFFDYIRYATAVSKANN